MGVMTASALIGTGLSAYQTIKSAKDKKDAQNAMRNYNRQELINPYENIKLSTYGTDVMREESARNTSTMVDALRGAGTRGIAQLPKLQANTNKVNQEIAMDLERQDLRRQQMIARGDERIMAYKEQRDIDNLGAISSQYNAANQDFNKGLWGVASGITSTMRNTDFGGFTPQVESVGSINSKGIDPFSSGINPITAPKLPI